MIENFKHSNLEDLIQKVIDDPYEFYVKICYALSIEERLSLIEQLKDKNCMNCSNGSCTIETYEKVGLNEYGEAEGSNCVGWFNAELIGKSRVLKK